MIIDFLRFTLSETRLPVFGVCLFAVGIIWIRTETVKMTYEYVHNEKYYRQLTQETQALRVRWLKATGPKRLEGMAHVLGLGPARSEQVMKYDVQNSNHAGGSN